MKKLTLMKALFAEVSQTERSAIKHPTVEARRLGPGPPATALLAVASHAARAEPSLKALAEARGATRSKVGTIVGNFFSIGRNRFADFMLTTEQSYRGTLLGMRHGYDVVGLFRLAALADGDLEVAAWCDPWLAEREPLIRAVAEQLRWFAAHQARALKSAKLGARAGA